MKSNSNKFLFDFIKLSLVASIIFFSFNLLADARVDGFYSADFVSKGFFKNKDFEIKEKQKFFISREERRINPTKAPSNNIKTPQTTIRVSNRLICLPGFGNCSESLLVYPSIK